MRVAISRPFVSLLLFVGVQKVFHFLCLGRKTHHERGFHKSLPGPVRRVKWIFWPFPYGARPAPFRFHGRRDNFKNPYGRRCVEDAAPNFPGVLFKPVARKQPVKDPAGCTRGPPGDQPANGRAPRDSFSPILVNKYNGHRTVSKGAGRLPFGARADP